MVVPEPHEPFLDEPRARLHLLEPERDRLLQRAGRLRRVVVGRRRDRGRRRGRRAQVESPSDRGVRVLRASRRGRAAGPWRDAAAHGRRPPAPSRSPSSSYGPTHLGHDAALASAGESPLAACQPRHESARSGRHPIRFRRAFSAFAAPVVRPSWASECEACLPGRMPSGRRRRLGPPSRSRRAPPRRPPGPRKHQRQPRAAEIERPSLTARRNTSGATPIAVAATSSSMPARRCSI